MSHSPAPAPRVAYGLVLLATALGPAYGTSNQGSAAPVALPAPAPAAAADTPPHADTSRAIPILIPCISGMCEVPLQAAFASLPTALSGDEPVPAGPVNGGRK